MRFDDVKIGTRLIGTFGSITLITLVMGGLTYHSLNGLEKEWDTFNKVSLKKSELISDSQTNLGDSVQAFKNYIIRKKDYDVVFQKTISSIEGNIDAYKKLSNVSDEEKAYFDKIAQGLLQYQAAMKTVVDLKNNGASIEEIDKSVKGADKVIREALIGLEKIVSAKTLDTAQSVHSHISSIKSMGLLCSIISLISTMMLAVLVTRSITKPIAEAVNNTDKVSQGDLSPVSHSIRKDETGLLLNALASMRANLSQIVANIRRGSESLVSSTHEISDGNQDLSRRTEAQASALEEIAATMEELTSTVKQNTEHTKSASSLTEKASNLATTGGGVVADVLVKMADIKKDSAHISEILSVIDSIAFQTNILALNAAVEAARAGEQGRGFAVVASEVRSLAQRSSAAAKEIKELINTSTKNIEEGGLLVDKAGIVMQQVVTAVKDVNTIVSEIATASTEQNQGVQSVCESISQLDNITQQNAALVEELAAAATQMNDQANELLATISYFKNQ